MQLTSSKDYVELYARLGFTLIPIYKNAKRPAVSWQRFQKEKPNEAKLRAWFEIDDYDMATICGTISDNLVVLDCDNDATFDAVSKHLNVVNKTLISKTPHGHHIFLRTNESLKTMHFVKDELKLDVQSEGALIVLPPSTFEDLSYQFNEISTFEVLYIENLKERLNAMLTLLGLEKQDIEQDTRLGDSGFNELLRNIHEGNRRTTLVRIVNYLKQKSALSEDAIYELLAHRIPRGEREIWDEKRVRKEIHIAYMSYDDEARHYEQTHKQEKKLVKLRGFALDVEKRVALIEGVFFKRDILLLYSPAGVGKSTYATNIVGAMLNATRCLELWETKESRVGLFDYEMPEDELKDRCLDVFGYHENFYINSYIGSKLEDRNHVRAIEENIREFKLDAIVIDCLSAACNVEDENHPAMRNVMNIIRGIAERTGVGVLLIHHTGKERQAEDGSKLPLTPRGHSSIRDSVEVEMQILGTESSEINKTKLTCTKRRRGKLVIYKGWTCEFIYDEESRILVPISRIVTDKENVVELIKHIRSTYRLTQVKLAELLSVNERTLQRWEYGEWYPASLSLTKIHQLEQELKNEYDVEKDPTASKSTWKTKTGRHTKTTGDVKIEQKNLSSSIGSPSSDGVRDKKKSMSPSKKKKSTTKTKKTEAKLDCEHCPLYKLYKLDKAVDGEGTGDIFILGQNPGEQEVAQGRPFVGDSGQFLNELLELASIDRKKCHVTNVIKCYTPNNRKPHKKEIACCRERLLKELEQAKPKLIITLGALALQALMSTKSVTDCHGRRFSYTNDCDLIAMYHPAAALHNPTLRETLKNDFRDINKASKVEDITGNYEVRTSATTLPRTRQVAIDCETSGFKHTDALLGTGIASSKASASYITHPSCIDTIEALQPIDVVMFNAKFDLKSLVANGVDIEKFRRIDDAMLLAILMNKPHAALKALTLNELNLNMTRYEDICPEGKTLADVDVNTVGKYCCADADATLRLFQKLYAECDEKTRRVYEEIELSALPAIVSMELNGVNIDVEYLEAEKKRLQVEIDKVLADVKKQYGVEEAVIRSTQKLSNLLYKELKLPVFGFTDKGKPSTREEVIEKLAGRNPIVDKILEYRSLDKLRNTFIKDLLESSVDGVIYANFHQLGTATGRLSCSSPNLQNLPLEGGILQAIIAPDGHVLLYYDYSQIQLRILAYVAQDKSMLKVFGNNEDIHSATADVMFDGKHDTKHRNLAKRINYAITKGGTYSIVSEIARESHLTLSQAQSFIKKFFKAYPDIKKNIDAREQEVLRDGYSETIYGRRRYDDKVFVDHEKIRQAGVRELLDAPIQGSEADIVKIAMARTYKIAPLVLQIHDALVYVVKQQDVKSIASKLQHELTRDFPLKLEVEAKVGKNLGELKKL